MKINYQNLKVLLYAFPHNSTAFFGWRLCGSNRAYEMSISFVTMRLVMSLFSIMSKSDSYMTLDKAFSSSIYWLLKPLLTFSLRFLSWRSQSLRLPSCSRWRKYYFFKLLLKELMASKHRSLNSDSGVFLGSL